MLILHIVCALLSISFSVYLYLIPTDTKVKVSYGLIGTTLVSGTLLIVSTGASILRGCLMGLFFSGFSIVMAAMAKQKLATETNRNN